MPALLELQRSFARAMIEEKSEIEGDIMGGSFSALERLQVYRKTIRSSSIAALGLTFPAVSRIVGDAFFQAAGEEFLMRFLPGNADLNEYGESFPAFLESFPPAVGVPYLADVARFEWALSVAAHADDVPPLGPASLGKVDPLHHRALRFEPHPSVVLLSLTYPADEIADAVLGGDSQAMAEVDLRSGPVHLIAHRGPDGVCARRVDRPAFELLRRMYGGACFAALLENAECDAASLLAEQLADHSLADFRIQEESDPVPTDHG